MNIADLLGLLLESTLATSAALLLVLLLRRPLRRAFGAAVAYASWALVPAAVIAVLLPAANVTAVQAPAAMTLDASIVAMTAVQAAAPIDVAVWLLVVWLAGVVAMALHLGRQQRAFRRGLGQLQPREDGLQQAETVVGLPAALGLWRPTIVVPADFDTRYSYVERQLMSAHERSHIVRGDLQINALVALLRGVFWFNPLLHHGARHFRHDQELACDLRVIARHPDARRAYGEAMFKTQLAAQPLPLGCHWLASNQGRSHPLTERIAMLKHPVPTAARWIGGSALVLVLAVGVGFAAWSAQPKRTAAVPLLPALPAPPVAPALPTPPVAPATPTPLTPLTPPAAPAPPTTPRLLLTPPRYPADAAKQGIRGKVVLVIDVAADGTPTAVKVERSEPAGVFDANAVEAVWKWRFQPAMEQGKPVAGRVRVPVEFEPTSPADLNGISDGSPPRSRS